MSKAILLTTGWSENYWKDSNQINFTSSLSNLTSINLETLANSCPLVGIGIYGNAKGKDFSYKPIEYIQISKIAIYDEKQYFYFERIGTSSILSSTLKAKLLAREFVTTLSHDRLLQILTDLGEKPPADWLKLLHHPTQTNGHKHIIEEKPSEFTIHDGERFRSNSEKKIYEVLKKKKVLFFVNPSARLGGQNLKREPDFLVCQEGKWGVLEVNGDEFHPNAAKDHDRARLFKDYGLFFIEAFSADECTNKPEWVVERFLNLLTKSSISQHVHLQEEFNATNTELKNQLNQAKQKVQLLQSQFESVQTSKADEITQLRIQLEQTSQKIESLQKQLNSTQANKIEEIRKLAESSEQVKKSYQNQLATLHANKTNELNKLTMELDESKKHIQSLQNEFALGNNTFESENHKLITELKQKTRTIQELEEQLKPDWVVYILVGLVILAAFLAGMAIMVAVS